MEQVVALERGRVALRRLAQCLQRAGRLVQHLLHDRLVERLLVEGQEGHDWGPVDAQLVVGVGSR